MYNTDTETLYPFRVTPQLRKYRSQQWKDLIDRLTSSRADPVEQIGFSLMMVKLGGCVTCSADSFRAMRGCTHCACQTIRRFRGPDEDLMQLFQENNAEVQSYLQIKTKKEQKRGY